MFFSDYLSAFLRQKRIDNLSMKSISNYAYFIERFLRFVGADTLPVDLTLERVQEYILSLHARHLSAATMATYIRNMKIFLRYVECKEPLSFSLAEIRLPRVPKKVVHILEDEEIRYIFSIVKSSSPWLSARNKAAIALMLDSGIRQGELCGLRLYNVSFSSCRMKVSGKGDKQRFVPLGSLSIRLLKDYLDLCPFKNSTFLFVNDKGHAMTGNAVRQFMERISHKLPFEFSSHRLRHNFATNFLLDMQERCGFMDCYQLMTIMGHSDIKITEGYLHAANEIIASRNYHSHLDKVLITL